MALYGHTRVIKTIAWIKNTKLIVSGSSDKTIRIWNLEDIEC